MKRARLGIPLATLVVILGVGPAVGSAGASDIPVAGAKLLVKDDTDNAARRKIVLVAKDEQALAIPTADGPDDPTRCPGGGAALEIRSAAGTESSSSIALPCEHWITTGSPVAGYRYKDRAGPVRSAVLKQRGGVLKVIVKGTIGTLTLDEPSQGALTAVFSLGDATRFCATFGGEVRKDAPGIFSARRAAAPSACPPPPATPTVTGTSTPIMSTSAPTVTPTGTPTLTITPTATPTPTPTPAMTATGTPTSTSIATPTDVPTPPLVVPGAVEFGDLDRDLDLRLCDGYCGTAHVTRLVRIGNVGTAPVTIDAVSSSDQSVFRIDEQSGTASIPSGGEYFVVVTFDPRNPQVLPGAALFEICDNPRPPAPAQEYGATLSVETSAGTVSVPLHGRTVDTVMAASLQPTPIGSWGMFCTHDTALLDSAAIGGILDFGTVAVDGSSTKTLRNLANVGGTAARVVGAEITGPDVAQFLPPVLQPGAGFAFPAGTPRLHQWNGGVDPAGAAVQVTFAPVGIDEPRPVAAVLVLHTDDGQAIEIGLTGEAYEGPLLSLSVEPAYEFERISAGSSARTTSLGSAAAGLTPATLFLANDGNRATGDISLRLTPISGSAPGGVFTHDFTAGPLAPFSERAVTLAFSPPSAGHYSAYLEVLEDDVVRASAILHGVGKGSGVSALGTPEPWYVVDDRSFDDTRVVAALPTGHTDALTALTAIPDPCLVPDPDYNVVDVDQFTEEHNDLSIVGGTVYAIDSDVFSGRDEDQFNAGCRNRLADGDLFGTGGVLKGNGFIDGPRGVEDLFAEGFELLELDVASDGMVFFTEVPPGGPTQLVYRKQGAAKVLVVDLPGSLAGNSTLEVVELRVIRTGSGYRLFVALDDPDGSSYALDVVGTTVLSIGSVEPMAVSLSEDARLGPNGLVYTADVEGTEIVVTATNLATGAVAATYRSGGLPFAPSVAGVNVDRLENVFVDAGGLYWFAPGGIPRGFVLASPVFYADNRRGTADATVRCLGETFGTAVVCLDEVWFGK